MKTTIKKVILLFVASFFFSGIIFAQKGTKAEEEIKDRAKQKVGMLCEYITTIADKVKDTRENRLHFSYKALSLFIGKGNSYEENGVTRKGVVMAVTSLNRKNRDGTPYINRPLMKNYLIGLANLDKRYDKVVIQHTDIADFKVSDLRPDPSGGNMLTCTVDIEQYFEGYNGDGQLLYYDKTVKRIKCYVIQEEVENDLLSVEKKYEYLVLLGDVESLETTKERKQ
jgi:hypothetical protein